MYVLLLCPAKHQTDVLLFSALFPGGVTPDQLATAEENLDIAVKHRANVIRSGGMGINTLNVGSFAGPWGVGDAVTGSAEGKSKGE